MSKFTPIPWQKFEKFLFACGCILKRTEGDHRIYYKPGMKRPIVVRTVKDLPKFEIKSNLRTLGINTKDYLKKIEEM